jgi:hypothetical protein
MAALPRARAACLIAAACAAVLPLGATPARAAEPAQPPQAPAAAAGQGVAVVGTAGLRDEAFVLARAVYATHLRPHGLDEPRARILAGDPAPDGAPADRRELAELRAAVVSEDAATRTVLASIANRVGAAALLVVVRAPGTDAQVSPAPPVVARLYLADSGDLDAARYAPEAGQTGAAAWRGTVASIARRFPAPPPAAAPAPAGASEAASEAAPVRREGSKPFWSSPWLWGALGAAALVGGVVFIASRDTSDSPIHLRMQLPR